MNTVVGGSAYRICRIVAATSLSIVVAVAVAQPAWSGVQPATSEVVVSGEVLSEGGKDPAANVRVQLMAFPKDMWRAGTKGGDKWSMTPLAVGVTGADGTYSLKLNPDVAVDHFASEYGLFHVDLIASSANYLAVKRFSIAVEGIGQVSENAHAVASRNGRIARAHKANLVLRKAAAGTDSPQSSDSSTNPQVLCWSTVTLVQNLGPRWVTVGMVSLKKADVEAEFTYENGSESMLGIGISYTGTYGSFTATAEDLYIANSTLGYGTNTGEAWLQYDTQFEYGKYLVEFSQLPGCQVPPYYEVSPIQFWGGQQTQPSWNVLSNYCAPMGTDDWYEHYGSRASTLAAGAQLSNAIGVNFSARTGHSFSTHLKLTFPTGGSVCGSSGPPGSNPGLISAKA